jgi:hypothetical protein
VRYPVALDDFRIVEEQRPLVVVAEVSDAGTEHDRYKINQHFVDQAGSKCLSGDVAARDRDVSLTGECLCLG